MKRTLIVTLAALAFIFSDLAMAREVQCDKAQKRCMTADGNLHVGDKVGILNDDGELQATGIVKGLRGIKRSIEIEQSFGPINTESRVVLLADVDQSGDHSAYKIQHVSAAAQVGVNLAYASLSSGAGLPGQELGLYGSLRQWGNLAVLARTAVLFVGGPVRIFNGTEFESPEQKTMGFGLLGGFAYQTKAARPFSLRTELGIGLMHVRSTLGGSAAVNNLHVDETKFRNGSNAYGRWGLSGVYNWEEWHFDGGIALSFVGQAIANSLVIGAAHDIN